MITHKEWKEFKKKNTVPDGIHAKISVGVVLDRYHKGKQTDADFAKLETDLKAYIKEANTKGQKKPAVWLQSMLNSEIAARAEAASKVAAAKHKLDPKMEKLYRGFISMLTTHHGQISTLAKLVKANPGWWAPNAAPADKAKRDKLCEGLQKQLDLLFKQCRDGGGETVDVSLAYAGVLGQVAEMSHDDLVDRLGDCLEKTKDTAEHIAESL